MRSNRRTRSRRSKSAWQNWGSTAAGLGEMLGIGSGRVSEILNRRRRLTIEMMRILAAKLAISERCLLRHYELAGPATAARRTRVHA